MNERQRQALDRASLVLHVEAKNLTHYLEHTLNCTVTMRTEEVVAIDDMTPHRVVEAVKRHRDELYADRDEIVKLLKEQEHEDEQGEEDEKEEA